MTIDQARRVLGALAKGMTDEEVLRDLDTANTLKNIFFALHTNK